MPRVRVRGGELSSRNLLKTTNGGDQDPHTMVGLIYRLTGDPSRALILIGLLSTLAGSVVLLLSVVTTPISLLAPTAGVATGGVMLIGLILRRVIRSRRR